MFRFEHTYRLTQSEYVAIWAKLDPTPPGSLVRRVIILVAGLAFVSWPYTMLLGVAILVFGAVGALAPHVFPGTAARNFREFRYLDGPVTYGVDQDRVWVRTPDFEATAGWRHVSTWRTRNDWLILQGHGFPPVLLPIAALETEGIYAHVMSLAQQHAVEWNSAAARRQRGFSL
jgi:hypothetical protein